MVKNRLKSLPLYRFAKGLSRSGQFRDAVRAADRARDAGRLDEAATCYKAALRLRPDHAGIWVQLGNVSKDASRFAESEDAYRHALAIEPNRSDTYLQLGHLMNRSERRADAVGFYERAVEADRANTHAFRALVSAAGRSDVLKDGSGPLSVDEHIKLDELVVALKRAGSGDYAMFRHHAFRKTV